jgi:hypothetical protein
MKTYRRWPRFFIGAALVLGGVTALGEYAIRRPSYEQGSRERHIYNADMKAADKVLAATQMRMIQTKDTLYASYKTGRVKAPENVPPEVEALLNERNNNQAAIARIQLVWERAGKACASQSTSAYCRGRRGEALEASGAPLQTFLTAVSGYYGPARNTVYGLFGKKPDKYEY